MIKGDIGLNDGLPKDKGTLGIEYIQNLILSLGAVYSVPFT